MLLIPFVVLFVFGMGIVAINQIEDRVLVINGKRLTDDEWAIVMMFCLVSALVAAFGVSLLKPI